MSEKKYTKGFFIKERSTSFGIVHKLSFNIESFTQWLKENDNGRGWVNVDLVKMKEPNDKSTHTAYLDDWKPQEKTTIATDEVDDQLPF